jgi:hypothetical protein
MPAGVVALHLRLSELTAWGERGEGESVKRARRPRHWSA